MDNDLDEDVDEDSPFDPIIIPPPTPISPIVFLDILNSESEFDQDSDGGMCGWDEPYLRLLGEITSCYSLPPLPWYLSLFLLTLYSSTFWYVFI